ncbi:MAG TPA: hypothetical protein VFH92_00835 [Phenylobacterium sp.]|nr:hypothetical protein [Phenylobacterium sp.]
MRFLAIYHPESGVEGGMPDPEHMAAMGRLIEEQMKSGTLVDTQPLAPRAQCARVRLADGAFTVSEEPLRAGGYAILNAGSLEEAIEGCKTFLKAAGPGVSEIRQIVDMGPPK